MKRFLLFFIGIALLVSGCTRPKYKKFAQVHSSAPSPKPSSAPPTVSPSIVPDTPSATGTPFTEEGAATPDFSSMSFAEKNDLYLQLLEEKRAAGIDTSAAEEAYLQSLKASFNGATAEADKYLEEAILLLLDS